MGSIFLTKRHGVSCYHGWYTEAYRTSLRDGWPSEGQRLCSLAVDGYRHIYDIRRTRLMPSCMRRTTKREANWNPCRLNIKWQIGVMTWKWRLNDFGLSSACVPHHYAIRVCQSLVVVPRNELHAISIDGQLNRSHRRCNFTLAN